MTQVVSEGRILRYYPRKNGHGYPAIVVRSFGGTAHNMTVFLDGMNAERDFHPDECRIGLAQRYSVPHVSSEGLGDSSPRWDWPPRV